MNTAQTIALAIHHHQAGQLGEAKEIYQQLLNLEPGNPTALHLLGLIIRQEGDLDQAEALIRASIRHDPLYAEAHNNLGNLLRDQARLEEALNWHLSALRIQPDDCETWFSLGLTCQTGSRLPEAREAYLHALRLHPAYAAAWMNLGNVLDGQGLQQEAQECLERAVSIEPGLALAHYNLARLLQRTEHATEAAVHYQCALDADPDLVSAWYNLGILDLKLDKVDESAECYRRALEIDPEHVDAINNLALTLKARGDIEGAIAGYRRALALRPGDMEIFSNLLMCLNYASDTEPGLMYAMHLDFAERFERELRNCWPSHDNLPDPERRLRIAYLSPDFRIHPVANFFEPVLRHHDREHFEVFCLYNHTGADAETEHLATLADHWWDISGLSDDVVASHIRDERIDILVDLAGHTAGNRLGVFARKPAPVQVTWLGYLNTTGLTAMDWRITDANADPSDAEAFYSERLLRLPDSQWCYRPFEGMPHLHALPALTNTHVTFGSFNNVAKVTDEALALWSRVLRRVDNSRLLMVGVPEGWARRRITSLLHEHGVEADRLTFMGKIPLEDYWHAFPLADIALDSFPYNGGTTTCDALWSGLPVVTLSGGNSASRGGRSLLATLGKPEWIAATPGEFADIACELAENLQALARTRATLRQQMESSPLRDEKTFTLNLEQAYRRIWRSWTEESGRA